MITHKEIMFQVNLVSKRTKAIELGRRFGLMVKGRLRYHYHATIPPKPTPLEVVIIH